MENNYLFLFLASGVLNDQGFWLIGIKNSDANILDAINLNLENLINDFKNKNIPLDQPPKGISFNIPLNILENIFDFWLEKYKDQEAWETCFGLLKIRRRISLTSLINSNSIKGDSKKWALQIEELHTYKPNSIENNFANEPMWR